MAMLSLLAAVLLGLVWPAAALADSNGQVSTRYFDGQGSLGYDPQSALETTGNPDIRTYYDGDLPSRGLPKPLQTFATDNALGRVSAVTDPTGGTLYSYDAAGRAAAQARWWTGYTTRPGVQLAYEYDAEGNPTAYEIAEKYRVEVAYGPGGRMESVAVAEWDGAAWAAADPLIDNIVYQPDGGEAERHWSNGVTEFRALDELGRLESVQWLGSSDDRTFTYGWDGEGNLLSESNGETITTTYTVDALDRLESAHMAGDSEAYGWDEAGNLEDYSSSVATGFSGYTHTGNRLVGATYDAAGRLTDDGALVYDYDERGFLASVTDGLTTVSYRHGANGLVVDRTTAIALRRGALITSELFVHDANGQVVARLIAHNGGKFSLAAFYVWAGGDPVAVVVPHRGTFALHTDWRGTVRGNSDTDGTMGGLAAYLPMGGEWEIQGELLAESVAAWATHGGPDALGLIDMRARTYSPELGRFLQPDPVWGTVADPQSLNRYVYARGNGAKFTDPDGRCVPLCLALVVGEATELSLFVAGYFTGASIGLAASGNFDDAQQSFELGQLAFGVAAAGHTLQELNRMTPYGMLRSLPRLGNGYSSVAKAGPGVESPGAKGRAGEARVGELLGLPKNVKPFTINGRTRLPDFDGDPDLHEVKNVQYQAFTRQLRDYTDLARERGGELNVWLRSDAEVSGTLQKAFNNPDIPIVRQNFPAK